MLAPRLVRTQLRSPILRQLGRRNATTNTPPATGHLSGATDNAFTRERAAVKAHAAASSGAFPVLPYGEEEQQKKQEGRTEAD